MQRTLQYEYGFQPDLGEALEILPGIHWLRLPLPFLLGHINVWLLRDGQGWAVVDTGIHTTLTMETWEKVFATHMSGAPITQLLVTHLHPDHVGCAGWLCERFETDLQMTREEYLLCRILVADTGLPAPPEGRMFYQRTGFTDDQISSYISKFGFFGKVVSTLPQSYLRLREGRQVRIGADSWQVITGQGHSPEHACLYNADKNVLISGDQVLPTISPNVSVYPTEPAANPLDNWFVSLRRLRELLPADVLVLPSHGKAFRGLHQRLGELIDEHETGLQKLRLRCRKPRRAVDVFPALFKGRITDSNLIMAAGEAVAHLNYLYYEGEMDFEDDADGVRWYQSRP